MLAEPPLELVVDDDAAVEAVVEEEVAAGFDEDEQPATAMGTTRARGMKRFKGCLPFTLSVGADLVRPAAAPARSLSASLRQEDAGGRLDERHHREAGLPDADDGVNKV